MSDDDLEGSTDEPLKHLIGTVVGGSKVLVERGPVANFAAAVCDPSPVYRDLRVAVGEGLDGIPAPPTYAFAMENWSVITEELLEDRPTGDAIIEAMGDLIAEGGLILHGEQGFEYHRPVVVGDVLEGTGTITDVYTKESKGHVMTFVVAETVWIDAKTKEPVVTTRFNAIHRL